MTRTVPFHVNLAGKSSNRNLVGFLGFRSENSDSDRKTRTPIGKLGLRSESDRNRWGSVKTSFFPQIHLKVRQGISLSMVHRWLHLKGFQYILHKKGLYFDGHDNPNVLAYHQNNFLPTMKLFEPCLDWYVVGDIVTQVPQMNFVEWGLVLCTHDESTLQANDTPDKAWVHEDQHHLWKKRCWLWTSPKWHYLFNSWLVIRCQPNSWIWKEL